MDSLKALLIKALKSDFDTGIIPINQAVNFTDIGRPTYAFQDDHT